MFMLFFQSSTNRHRVVTAVRNTVLTEIAPVLSNLYAAKVRKQLILILIFMQRSNLRNCLHLHVAKFLFAILVTIMSTDSAIFPRYLILDYRRRCWLFLAGLLI